MRINFLVNPVYTYGDGGWSPESKRLGGSEEFVVEVAKRLARRKHKVGVYHNGKHGFYNRVSYQGYSAFKPGEVTINVNYPEFQPKGKTIYWTSLTSNPDLSVFDAVCVISEYAKNHTNTQHKNLYNVPPGYDPKKIYPGMKIPKQCFYASSPDRGLDTLLEAWPKVYEAHPDATLILTYGAESDLPGVISLGEVDEDTMNEIYKTSKYWLHPANGGELYCMTGIKAQAADCWPIYFPIMALQETVRYGTKSTPETFADDVIEALSKDIPGDMGFKYPTWEDSTQMLLDIIQSVLENTTTNTTR